MTTTRKKIKKPDWAKDMRFRLPLCIAVAAFLGLVAHVWLAAWSLPIIHSMTANIVPPEQDYSNLIIFMAYATACITVGLVAVLYHYLGQYMPVRKKWQRILLLAAIVLEIKGDLIRQPVMDYIVNVTLNLETPFRFVVVNQMDKWVSTLLLSGAIVYLCPVKKDTAKKKS